MLFYTTGQWTLFFFFYCFCGWIWESCYVSACQRNWINRGFLHGPWLPLYGSGAILVLFVTLKVRENMGMVWLLGMIFATILEYVTGYVMEKVYKVRYWDYSSKKFQINGYISLISSIAWGFFSVLLVFVVHPQVEHLLRVIPSWIVDPLSLILTILFSVDTVCSIQAALDFRELLANLTKEHDELRMLAKRAEIIAALAEDDLKRFRARTELESRMFSSRLMKNVTEYYKNSKNKKMKRKEKLELLLSYSNDMKLDVLDAIAETLNKYSQRMSEFSGMNMERFEERKRELNDLAEKIKIRRIGLQKNSMKLYKRAFRIIHSHPSASVKEFKEALETLRKMDKDKFDK